MFSKTSAAAALSSFVRVQKEISALARIFKGVGMNATYLRNKFGIDAEYFADWLREDESGLAELVVLFLPETTRAAILSDVSNLSGLCH
jgi:hypothetical protein